MPGSFRQGSQRRSGAGVRKFTVTEIRDALEVTRGAITAAAKYLEEVTGEKCSINTIRSEVERHKILKRTIQDQQDIITDVARAKVIEGVFNGDRSYVMRWLEKYDGWGKSAPKAAQEEGTESTGAHEIRVHFVTPPERKD